MSRYVSFRDFDWLLLVFVLMIAGVGVMEIQSGAVHTKFAGSHIRQIYWILGGVGAMFVVSAVNYQALLDRIHWFYIAAVASLMAGLFLGQKDFGARRWIKMPGGNHFHPFQGGRFILNLAGGECFSPLPARDPFVAGFFYGVRG